MRGHVGRGRKSALRLVAAVATLLASAAGAEMRYLPLATFAAGDKPGDVASYSEVVLTEYRFQAGGHSYAMSRALRSEVARDLVSSMTDWFVL